MTDNTAMNSQVTDAVSQALVDTIAQSPSFAVGSALTMVANAHALGAAQAVQIQYEQAVTLNAVAAAGAERILGGE